jgi:hypothetical protein
MRPRRGPKPFGVADATKSLFKMKAQSKFYNLPHGNGFDALEVHTCRDDGECVEQLNNSEDLEAGDFFSLYGHIAGLGLECIGDFTTFEAACTVAENLGGAA